MNSLRGIGETERADINEEGPGMGTTWISCWIASSNKRAPGSANVGVPQSEINASESP